MTRAGVVLVEDGSVAAIERVRAGYRYHLLPGGQVEPGEEIAEAAAREATEELGVDVRIEGLVAIVHHRDAEQHYFLARSIGGTFGTGDGPEMGNPVDSRSGSYRAVWLPVGSLVASDLRPPALATRLAADATLPAWRTLLHQPLVIHEQPTPLRLRHDH